jgi:hypothetical protein
MNHRHPPKSERNLNAHSSSNNAKKILRAIAVGEKSLLSYIWDIVSMLSSNEPRIWQRRDRVSVFAWHIKHESVSSQERIF